MVRTVARRLRTGGAVVLAVGVFALAGGSAWAGPGPAGYAAAPSAPAAPTSATITGEGLDGPLTVSADTNEDAFDNLITEIDYLATYPNVLAAPKPDKLGPKYTVVVSFGAVARQQYDLYPLAAGGPKAYRPAAQPDKHKTTAAWIYGRLTMPTTLRGVGVPVAGGAIGGGGGGVVQTTNAAAADIGQVMGEWRRVVALNGAIVVLIAAGLFGMAFLIRRKI